MLTVKIWLSGRTQPPNISQNSIFFYFQFWDLQWSIHLLPFWIFIYNFHLNHSNSVCVVKPHPHFILFKITQHSLLTLEKVCDLGIKTDQVQKSVVHLESLNQSSCPSNRFHIDMFQVFFNCNLPSEKESPSVCSLLFPVWQHPSDSQDCKFWHAIRGIKKMES